jgi:hypothetical protein
MEEGFSVDLGDASMPTVGHWHAGKPVRKWWGLKIDKHAKREIVTLRCTSCGYLESYAP